MGFEPTHKGTTILGLNRLTTSAISLLIYSNTNKILINKKYDRKNEFCLFIISVFDFYFKSLLWRF